MPRILFCCPTPLTVTLGASKVYIEAAEAFRRIGWYVKIVGPEEVARGTPGDLFNQPRHLREYLRREADHYDVVEYEHHALPFDRSEFSPRPLFVARSVLLAHTQAAADIPSMPTLRGRLGWALVGRRRQRRHWRAVLEQATATVQSADLVNLPNTDERDALVAAGIPTDKLLVYPFGLFPERVAEFTPTPERLPDPPRIGFVGTFDPRKGLCEWPALAAGVTTGCPGAQFRLVGTAGIVPTVEGVWRFFPARLRDHIEVVPKYEPSRLPELLADVSVGVFPSRCEGFPFGVLELLTAGVPVFGYGAPGLPMLLPADQLVTVGDGRALARRVVDALTDRGGLIGLRRKARIQAERFQWMEIAERTAEEYICRVRERAAS